MRYVCIHTRYPTMKQRPSRTAFTGREKTTLGSPAVKEAWRRSGPERSKNLNPTVRARSGTAGDSRVEVARFQKL